MIAAWRAVSVRTRLAVVAAGCVVLLLVALVLLDVEPPAEPARPEPTEAPVLAPPPPPATVPVPEQVTRLV